MRLWALVENGMLSNYYSLAYITFTKRQALIEARSKNQVLKHKMKVVPIEARFPKGMKIK